MEHRKVDRERCKFCFQDMIRELADMMDEWIVKKI